MTLINASSANFALFPIFVSSKNRHSDDDIKWALETFGESAFKSNNHMIDPECRWIHMPISRAARFKTESDAVLFKLRFS